MAFVRVKIVSGFAYAYLVQSEWTPKGPRQKQLKYLGRVEGCDKLTSQTVKSVLERDSSKCKNCGAVKGLTIDHIVPILDGGNNAESNLQVLCKKCNASGGRRGKRYDPNKTKEGLNINVSKKHRVWHYVQSMQSPNDAVGTEHDAP